MKKSERVGLMLMQETVENVSVGWKKLKLAFHHWNKNKTGKNEDWVRVEKKLSENKNEFFKLREREEERERSEGREGEGKRDGVFSKDGEEQNRNRLKLKNLFF